MLARFMAAYPLVDASGRTNRRVDVIGEGIDMAHPRPAPPLEDSDLVMRVLGRTPPCLVASPALAIADGRAVDARPISMRLPSMDLGLPQNQHSGTCYGPDGTHMAIHHQPRLVTRGMSTLRDAALAGMGVVQLPR